MATHVYPLGDWIEHDTESLDCQCEPEVQWINPEQGCRGRVTGR